MNSGSTFYKQRNVTGKKQDVIDIPTARAEFFEKLSQANERKKQSVEEEEEGEKGGGEETAKLSMAATFVACKKTQGK